MDETLGQRIERLRKAAGLGQKELGHRVGLSESAVSNLESGKVADLKLPVGIKMAREFGVSVEELQTGIASASGKPQPPVDERTRQLAEIGETVVALVQRTPLVIVPSDAIDHLADDDEEMVEWPVYDAFAADRLDTNHRQVQERIKLPKRLIETARRPLVILITGDCLMRENARLRQALLAYMAWSERMWQETDRGWDDETSWLLSREEYDQASAALAGDDSNVCNEGAGKAGGKPMKT